MADQPIGINFIPSAQNQAEGPRHLSADGGLGSGSTDLAAAYKILSLRLPQFVGAQAPTPQSNLTSAGSAGLRLPGGLDPHAALFQAFIRSILGGEPSDPMTGMTASEPIAMPGLGAPPPMTPPRPKFTFGTPDATGQTVSETPNEPSGGRYERDTRYTGPSIY